MIILSYWFSKTHTHSITHFSDAARLQVLDKTTLQRRKKELPKVKKPIMPNGAPPCTVYVGLVYYAMLWSYKESIIV